MIGRNRTLAASRIASRGALAVVPLRLDREVDHHDRVLLHDADQHDDADEGVDAQVLLEDHQRQQRAEPGERQARQDRERVDEALVQDAEHEVDHQDREDQQDQQALLGVLERRAVPEKLVLMVEGSTSRAAASTPSTAVPIEVPGSRLNESVTEGSWPEWFTVSGPDALGHLRQAAERHGDAVAAGDVQQVHGRQVALVLRAAAPSPPSTDRSGCRWC